MLVIVADDVCGGAGRVEDETVLLLRHTGGDLPNDVKDGLCAVVQVAGHEVDVSGGRRVPYAASYTPTLRISCSGGR